MHEYSYAKDAFRHASLIAELTAQLCFTQARLRVPSWRAMRSPQGGGETRYGLTLMAIRILLFAVDEYAQERLYAEREREERDVVRRTILPVVVAYLIATLVGVILPGLAVGLYCLLAIYLVIPLKELTRILFHRS